MSLEEYVKSNLKGYNEDPFWGHLIIKYFKEELKIDSDTVAILHVQKLMKYDDILNEFCKSLVQKKYNFDNALEINGYSAKKIHQLNGNLNNCGVYTFMVTLRDNYDDAKRIIEEGFKIK